MRQLDIAELTLFELSKISKNLDKLKEQLINLEKENARNIWRSETAKNKMELTNTQFKKALSIVEDQVFRHPDDIQDVDDTIDQYTIEVQFYTYADEISIQTDEDGDPMVYIFDSDKSLVQPDTNIFRERVQEMVNEANEILLASYDQADDYIEFDDDYGDYYY